MTNYGYLITAPEADRLAAIEAENRRLRERLAEANAANCALERDKQALATMWSQEHERRVRAEMELTVARAG